MYYHPWKTCVAPNFADFNPCRDILVNSDVKSKLHHLLANVYYKYSNDYNYIMCILFDMPLLLSVFNIMYGKMCMKAAPVLLN